MKIQSCRTQFWIWSPQRAKLADSFKKYVRLWYNKYMKYARKYAKYAILGIYYKKQYQKTVVSTS